MNIEFPDSRDAATRIRDATPPHTVRPWPLPIAESPRVTNLTKRLAACGDATELRDLEETVRDELANEGTPLWETDSPGWTKVTFIMVADAPHGVVLQLNRMTDPIDVADTMLVPLAGSRVHALTLRVPDTWMGGYLFVPLPFTPELVLHQGVPLASLRPLLAAAREDPAAREHIHNKLETDRPGGAPKLAVARAPAAPTVATWRDAQTPVRSAGTVNSEVNATELPLWTWSHARANASSPILLLTDGEVWREQFPIIAELARRVDAGECDPVHVVFLDSGGSRQRQLDYPADPGQSSRFLDSIHGAVADHLGSGPWILAGQSLGGLFAMLCATRHPNLIAAAVAQSPSLWWPAAPPHRHSRGWFEERADTATGAPIFLETGIYDWLLIDRTRDASALLRAQKALIGYTEFAAGHDVLQWQATLPDAIATTVTYLANRQ